MRRLLILIGFSCGMALPALAEQYVETYPAERLQATHMDVPAVILGLAVRSVLAGLPLLVGQPPLLDFYRLPLPAVRLPES